MVKKIILIIISIAIGVMLTFLTGQFLAPFETTQVDVVQYGAPLSWTSRVIPTHFSNYNLFNLIMDIAFWSVIVFFIAWAATRMQKPRLTEPKK